MPGVCTATQNTSGRFQRGSSGPSGGRGANVRGVAMEGIGKGTSWGVAVVKGFPVGPQSPAGAGVGPNNGFDIQPVFLSSVQRFRGSFSINGITRDSTGALLGNCTTHLFQTGSDAEIAQDVSDGVGNYSFIFGFGSGNFYIVAYLSGSPDVSGTTLNTLTAGWNGN